MFLASLVLLVPLSTQEHEYNLLPFEPKSIIVNVQNTKLIVSSNRITEVYTMEISYLNPETPLPEVLQISQGFEGENPFDIEQRGFYEIIIEAEAILTITITTEGIPDSTIIIVSLMMLLAIGSQVQKQFSRSFDY